ncbi:MAG: Holliday junction branch migration protein RuvA [Deltaproteobacteria bacterium]|nr:Holliday junction branch migration protein RuvA [Deltaproteobacteria bacterium]MBW2648341.1 Holliday junction branch migration protein RuvA [Deltaproteobacteria bacterium]
MIASLKGVLSHKSIDHIIVDVHGIGCSVTVPLGTFYKLPDTGSQVHLVIHTHIAQDAVRLFGFLDYREKDIFKLLISVSGIGPRLAINILSGISPEDLSGAISDGDLGRLVGIPGVGKKTAERMIFELKDKITKLVSSETSAGTPDRLVRKEALSALINLGYKNNIAKDAIDKVVKEAGRKLTLEILLTESLKILSGR